MSDLKRNMIEASDMVAKIGPTIGAILDKHNADRALTTSFLGGLMAVSILALAEQEKQGPAILEDDVDKLSQEFLIGYHVYRNILIAKEKKSGVIV